MLSNARRAVRSTPRGQVLVIFTLFIVVLLAAAALTVDYGSWLKSRRDYQNVADAAVLAGVAQLSRPLSTPCDTSGLSKAVCARRAAWTSLNDQLSLGLTAGAINTLAATNTPATPTPTPTSGGYRIWVDSPASAAAPKYQGGYSTVAGTVFAWVEKDSDSYLARIIGQGAQNVSAWATAGLFPNRWAILALCPKGDSTCIQAKSIDLAGTNTSVKLINGDMGSNWSLKVTSGTSQGVQVPGDSQVYLVDYDKCASSTWTCTMNPGVTGGIQDPTIPARKDALPMRPMAIDPGYALPAWIDDTTTAVPTRTTGGSIVSTDAVDPTLSSVHCDGSATVLGPGYYDTIDINKGCVILDPTLGLTNGQQPGIFRIRSQFTLGNGAFVIGDGVSLFFDSTVSHFSIATSGGLILNTGNAGHAEQSKAAWTTNGLSPWSTSGSAPSIVATYNTSTLGNGLTVYIRKPTSGKTSIFNDSGGYGIQLRGVVYGPSDNLGIGGNSAQHSSGQIVGWTIKYNGTTELDQTYEGTADERPRLLEPTLGQ